MNPESVPYPWRAALVTWIILGVESALLYLLVRGGRRLRLALAITTVLLIASVLTLVTDMPGYYYIPYRYQLVLVVAFAVAVVVQARQGGTVPPRAAV